MFRDMKRNSVYVRPFDPLCWRVGDRRFAVYVADAICHPCLDSKNRQNDCDRKENGRDQGVTLQKSHFGPTLSFAMSMRSI